MATNAAATTPTAVNVPATLAVEAKNEFLALVSGAEVGVGSSAASVLATAVTYRVEACWVTVPLMVTTDNMVVACESKDDDGGDEDDDDDDGGDEDDSISVSSRVEDSVELRLDVQSSVGLGSAEDILEELEELEELEVLVLLVVVVLTEVLDATIEEVNEGLGESVVGATVEKAVSAMAGDVVGDPETETDVGLADEARLETVETLPNTMYP